MKSVFALLVVIAVAACTPGGMLAGSGSSGGGTVTTIDINLTLHPDGYLPDTVTVPVGTGIRFFNSDSFAHTATLIPGATSFPAARPFNATATQQLPQNGPAVISQPWSSGALQAGSGSQTITVDAPGTYLYGCYFHYSAPMHGTIVAQ